MITITFTQTNYHKTIAFYVCASFEFQGFSLNTKVSVLYLVKATEE